MREMCKCQAFPFSVRTVKVDRLDARHSTGISVQLITRALLL
jgi:hypothetical protein